MNDFRKDFPLFKSIDEKTSTLNPGLVYLDTAATAQRPFCVLEAMNSFYAQNNANPLRGIYDLSERATKGNCKGSRKQGSVCSCSISLRYFKALCKILPELSDSFGRR